jgi:phytoene dehydrogenase-like protein
VKKTRTLVVGAGAGGLFAALLLQRAGHEVVLLEAKAHVGGCASAFSVKGFRFLAGATTLIGLEPEMPLGRVLRELDVEFHAPAATTNLTVLQGGGALTLSHDVQANDAALTAAHGPALARFWRDSAALGARAWRLVTDLHFPPRGPGDLLSAAGHGEAWRLLPALLSSTGARLDAAGITAETTRRLVDELLLVSTQAGAGQVPYLFGALGLEYLQRPLYLAEGGLASLLERLAGVFVERGGELHLDTAVTRLERRGPTFVAHTAAGPVEADRALLNLTHWDAQRLVEPALEAAFTGTVRRHPDAWAACTLHLGVRDVFAPDAAPYFQLVLDAPLPVTGAHALFVTLGRADDRTVAPEGFRAVTVSCHVPARDWEPLDDAAHAERKARVGEELVTCLAAHFPGLGAAEKPVVLPGTPRTWQGFTGRRGGRVGGLPFDWRTLRAGYPTGRTSVPGLWRVGDTVFPGQSVPACAWGARRVVREVLSAA